jgi:tRNA(His) 5'-end guanylyltransferase
MFSSLPQDDVCNYFIWRQIDATRNAIQMAGREHFSHKELHKVNCNGIQEKLFQEKGINFNDYPTVRKRGFCIVKGVVDLDIPIFTKDREYVERWVYVRED